MTDKLSNTALINLERQLNCAVESGASPGPLTARRLLTEDLPRVIELIHEVRQDRAEVKRARERTEQVEKRLIGVLDALRAQVQAADSDGLQAAVEVWSGRTARGVPFQSWPPNVRRLYEELTAAEAALRHSA